MEEVRRLYPYVRPYLSLVIVAGVLLILSGFLEAVIIMLLAPIFDQLAPSVPSASTGSGKFAFLQGLLGLHGDSYLVKIATLSGPLLAVQGCFSVHRRLHDEYQRRTARGHA